MREELKRVLPEPLIAFLSRARWSVTSRREFVLDRRRYRDAAMPDERSLNRLTLAQLEAQLTRDYHKVEKGLSLAAPKRPFGAESLARLERLIPVAEARDPNAPWLAAAISARDALRAWNGGAEADPKVSPRPMIAPVLEPAEVSKFFGSRHSVRNFSQDPVDLALVESAITGALASPSVCNREPWRVRLFSGDDARRVLKFQNGSGSFAASIPLVALISVELGHFFGAGERNQAWIEGGIFASSFVWALHGLGLQSCMLNLSVSNRTADGLRRAADLPGSEVPIMMVAIGHAADDYRVARSPRRRLDDVLVRPTA